MSEIFHSKQRIEKKIIEHKAELLLLNKDLKKAKHPEVVSFIEARIKSYNSYIERNEFRLWKLEGGQYE